jgi:hypothetical protein
MKLIPIQGRTNTMMELLVCMEFACYRCAHNVEVTVKCEGKGLVGGLRNAVAAVNISCPSCDSVNRVLFEPNGTVRDVLPSWISRPAFEPSLN